MFEILSSTIAKVLIAPIIFVMSLAGYVTPVDNLNDNLGSFYTVGAKSYYLGGAGVGSTDSSITLTSFTVPVSNVELTMANFGEVGFATIDPSSPTRQEFISFTGVTQNSDDTAVLTGVSRGLMPIYPYTASTTYQKAHPGGSVLIISNSPQIYNEYAAKKNAETITGPWTFSSTTKSTIAPTTATDIVNLAYATSSLVTIASTQTVTGAKTFSATTTMATTTVNGKASFTQNVTIPETPVANTDAASKAYVDVVVVSDAPTANETTTGIARKATSAQIASGYASSTPYFIPSSLASSTASTTASIVVVANASGTIDPSFISTTTINTALGTLLTDKVQTAVIDVSSAEIKTLFSSPKVLISAPGAGKIIDIITATVKFTYGGTQYTDGGTVLIEEETTGTDIVINLITPSQVDGTSDVIRRQPASTLGTSSFLTENKGMVLTNPTQNFATGNGTMKVYVLYRVITL